jgi:hypothetical protein
LVSSLQHAGGVQHHDPSTLELAAMAAITVTAFIWMKRLQAIRERAATELESAVHLPVAKRYADAMAQAAAEEIDGKVLTGTEHVA